MKNWAIKEIHRLEVINRDTLFQEQLIEYLDAEIISTQKEFLEFVHDNITTLEQ